MPPHSLINFKIQKYFQSKAVYSRNDLSKIKDGAYVTKSWWV